MSPEQQEVFDAAVSRLQVIAAAMAGGVVLCMATVGFTFKAVGTPNPHAPLIAKALAALAAASCLGLRALLLSQKALKSLEGEGFPKVLGAIQTRMIVVLSACEMAGFLGLFCFVLSGNRQDIGLFTALSLSMFAVLWPRREDLERLVAVPGGQP